MKKYKVTIRKYGINIHGFTLDRSLENPAIVKECSGKELKHIFEYEHRPYTGTIQGDYKKMVRQLELGGSCTFLGDDKFFDVTIFDVTNT